VSGRLYDPMTRLCLYAGGLLLVNQARDLIGSLIPSDKIQRSPLLSGLFTPSFIRGASRSKRAATRKVNRYVRVLTTCLAGCYLIFTPLFLPKLAQHPIDYIASL
jgi:hypothetical protein